MDINDIITLANAGYTKSDITALLGFQTPVPAQIPAQAPAQIPAQVPTQIPAQVPTQIPAQAPVQTPKSDIVPAPPTANVPVYAPSPIPAQDDSINKMLAEMSLLRKDLQTSNIINSQQPKVETADDIIAKIINPPIVKKEG